MPLNGLTIVEQKFLLNAAVMVRHAKRRQLLRAILVLETEPDQISLRKISSLSAMLQRLLVTILR
jgi:hypothetical protein